jgi:hypothetical protein
VSNIIAGAVIASAAKQSTPPLHVWLSFDHRQMDGFASLAMTGGAALNACRR